jgi:thiol-disulfide isomerase/thioredoxin
MWDRAIAPVSFAALLLLASAVAADEPTPAPRQAGGEVSPGHLGLDRELLADPKRAAQAADWLEEAYRGARRPESVRMLIAILRGSQMGPGDGWFGPAETRFIWKWLAERHDLDPAAAALPAERFRGPPDCFRRLDRDGDGRITPGDLDWSDRNPFVQQSNLVNRLFRRLNARGDGKLTRAELDQFFQRASRGKEYLTSDDLRDALLSGAGGGFQPGDAPSTAALVRGLFAGEIGSMNEGPHVGEAAPDFTLKTADGKDTIRLGQLLGPRPVVLVFGNFTCGPFRSFYPDVEAVYQRHKDAAAFVMVYVREAHPTDGWHMESNARSGVAVRQPTTYAERVKVCDQFCERLHPAMPVVVDEINDPVGHAYSGMPARMYVIDAQGKVAYKSGRGPFGFRVGEMEQALVMALLEGELNKQPPKSASR